MKKHLRRLAKSVVALSTLVTFGAVPLALAASGSDTCTWIGGGSDTNWSTVANWSNCSGAAPVSGDAIGYDNTSAASNISTSNDIAGLTLASITMSGTSTNNYSWTISGQSLTLAGGTNNTSTGGLTMNAPVTLSADQTFNYTYMDGLLTIGSFSLTANDSTVSDLSGSGTVSLNNVNSGSFANGSSNGSPNFTGTLVANSGTTIEAYKNYPYSAAKLVIKNGGNLDFVNNSANPTISNDITLEGDGGQYAYGALSICAAYDENASGGYDCPMTADAVVTFTGHVTLSGDAKVRGADYKAGDPTPSHKTTLKFTGEFTSNGYALTAFTGSNTFVQIGADPTAAKAPNTGFAAAASKPVQILSVTLLVTGSLYFVSRRVFAKAGIRN